jgi:energy-coupling factor transporter ATP-binding protein EcfA2
METLLTTQINTIWDGLKNGQRPLIINIGQLLGALVIIWRVYGSTTGSIVVTALIVVVVILNRTLGRGQYHRLSSALSVRSLTERLLRHYVRPRGLFFHSRHDDPPSRALLAKHLEERRAKAVLSDQWTEGYQFAGISILSLVILASAVIVILESTTFTTLLSSIILLVTQGETFIGALDALTKGLVESQSIEVGAQRLHREILDKPQMQHLTTARLSDLLKGPLTVRLAAVKCRDVYTKLEVLHDVNLVFSSGQVVLLLGGHKTGKTELADAITAANLPILGDVFFNGISTSRLPFSAYGVFPKKIFNLDENLGNTIAQVFLLEESNRKRLKTLQLELQKLQKRRNNPTLLAALQKEMMLLSLEKRKLSHLRWLANELAKILGVDKAFDGLPQGYNTRMYDVVRYFSEDQKWALAFMRSVLMAVATEGQLPRMIILDQSIDELNDPQFIKRMVQLLNRLAHNLGVLVLITSTLEERDFQAYGLQADQVVHLEQFKPPVSVSQPASPVVVYRPFAPTTYIGTMSSTYQIPLPPPPPHIVVPPSPNITTAPTVSLLPVTTKLPPVELRNTQPLPRLPR